MKTEKLIRGPKDQLSQIYIIILQWHAKLTRHERK